MNDQLMEYLEDLESRIDPEEEERILEAWKAFAGGRFGGSIFAPARRRRTPPRASWPEVRVNAALDDFDQMALQQYKGCSDALANGSGTIMAVRCNYGTSILPSLYGVKLFIMDDALNTLPTSWPLDGRDAIGRVIEGGIPDLYSGWGSKVFEMGRRFQAIAREFPKIGRYVSIYHPDLQGPMDVCEVVWGSGIFCEFFESPDLVKALLNLVVRTYIAFLREWETIVPLDAEGNVHWGIYHKGKILLRDDSAMNVSPDLFGEFIQPYDQRLLDEFGGGAIHFCGRGDHFIKKMSEMWGLYAINMSQPHLNNMEIIFQNTVDKHINILDLPRAGWEQARADGRNLRGRVSCLSIVESEIDGEK